MRLLVVLAAALVLAAPVGGAPRPAPRAELFVNPLDTRPGVAGETDVDLSLAAPTTSVTEYVPAGYTLALDRRPGTAIGSATVITPRARTTAILFTTAHAGEWAAGRLAVLVDRTTDGYELTFSPPADAIDVDLDLRGVLANPAAPSILTWQAIVTPARGPAFEVRSIVGVPQTLTLLPRPGAALTLRGRLLFADQPRPGVNVHLAVATREDLTDAREIGVATTRPDGRYIFRRALDPVKRTQLFLIASVNFYESACSGPSSAPGGCADQSIAPPPSAFTAISVR